MNKDKKMTYMCSRTEPHLSDCICGDIGLRSPTVGLNFGPGT